MEAGAEWEELWILHGGLSVCLVAIHSVCVCTPALIAASSQLTLPLPAHTLQALPPLFSPAHGHRYGLIHEGMQQCSSALRVIVRALAVSAGLT